MRYSFMSFSTPEMSLAEMLDTAGRFGYDGIEPRMDAGHAHGVEINTTPEQREAIRGQAEDAGIALSCLATSLKYADPSTTDDMMEQTRQRIELAADIGAPVIRVFGGALPEGQSREDAIELLIHCLGMASEWATDKGVTLCLETHDDWTDPRHVATVLARIGHAGVAANWDVMHPVRTGKATMDESFEALKPWIRHLHVHDGRNIDEKLQLTPIGEGLFDHKRVIDLLKTIDYDGAISGEWINWDDPWDVHLPRELATLKGYES